MKHAFDHVQRMMGVTRSEAIVVTSIAVALAVGTIGRTLWPDERHHAHATADKITRILDSLDAAGTVSVSDPSIPTVETWSHPGSKRRASPPATPQRRPCNINVATAAELEAIPGIGPAMARRIIEARQRRPFTTVDDLLDVRGIGERTLERMRPYVVVP